MTTLNLFNFSRRYVQLFCSLLLFSSMIITAKASCNFDSVPGDMKGNFTICNSDFSPFSISLNRTNYANAEAHCQKFGRKLAILKNPNDLLHIAFMMYECAFLTGIQLNSGWINPEQPNLPLLNSSNSQCMGVNARGGVIAGSPALCDLNMSLYVICKTPMTLKDEEDVTINEESSGSEPMAITRIFEMVKIRNLDQNGSNHFRNNGDLSSSYDSDTSSRSESHGGGPNIGEAITIILEPSNSTNNTMPVPFGSDEDGSESRTIRDPQSSTNDDQAHRGSDNDSHHHGNHHDNSDHHHCNHRDHHCHHQNNSTTKTIDGIVNVDSSDDKFSWTTPNPTPTPTCHPGESSSSCDNCTPIPGLIVAPFHLLGFKLIQTKLPYHKAECACKQLGMRLAYPNFITQWLAALVIHQGSIFRPLAWIDSVPSQGHQSGCLAMRASHLIWNGPRIEAHNCFEHLPVLCQGPIIGNWNEILDMIQLMDKVMRFMPGMEQMPKMCPFIKEIMSSLKPLPNVPNMDQLLEGIFSGNFPMHPPSSSGSTSSSFPKGTLNGQMAQLMNNPSLIGQPSKMESNKVSAPSSPSDKESNSVKKLSSRGIPPAARMPGGSILKNLPSLPRLPIPNPLNKIPAFNGSPENPQIKLPRSDNISDIAEAISGPLRDLLTHQLGSSVASQIVSQVASMVAGSLMPPPIKPQPNPISSILSSLFSSSLPLPMPIHFVSQAEPIVIGSIDALRIVTTESKSPAEACNSLGLELGAYNASNLEKVINWAKENKIMATFVDEKGYVHLVMPNGAVYHQLIKLAVQISNHAVCQIVKSMQPSISQPPPSKAIYA